MATERKERLLQEIEASTSKIVDIEYMLMSERKRRERLYEELLLVKYGWVAGKTIVITKGKDGEPHAYRVDGISAMKDGAIESLRVAHMGIIGFDQEEIGYNYYANWANYFEGRVIRTFEDLEAYHAYIDSDGDLFLLLPDENEDVPPPINKR